MLDNPPEVATEKFDRARSARRAWNLAPGPRNDRLAITGIFVITDIVGRIAISKAIRKYLVKDGVVNPCWCMVARKDAKICRVRRRILDHSGSSEPPVALFCQQQKAIVIAHHLDVDIPLPPTCGRVFCDQPQRSHVLLAIRISANENAFNRRIQAGTHAELYG